MLDAAAWLYDSHESTSCITHHQHQRSTKGSASGWARHCGRLISAYRGDGVANSVPVLACMLKQDAAEVRDIDQSDAGLKHGSA